MVQKHSENNLEQTRGLMGQYNMTYNLNKYTNAKDLIGPGMEALLQVADKNPALRVMANRLTGYDNLDRSSRLDFWNTFSVSAYNEGDICQYHVAQNGPINPEHSTNLVQYIGSLSDHDGGKGLENSMRIVSGPIGNPKYHPFVDITSAIELSADGKPTGQRVTFSSDPFADKMTEAVAQFHALLGQLDGEKWLDVMPSALKIAEMSSSTTLNVHTVDEEIGRVWWHVKDSSYTPPVGARNPVYEFSASLTLCDIPFTPNLGGVMLPRSLPKDVELNPHVDPSSTGPFETGVRLSVEKFGEVEKYLAANPGKKPFEFFLRNYAGINPQRGG